MDNTRSEFQASDSDSDSEFVSLLTAHQGILHAYLVGLLPGEFELDDILQKANIVLWEKRHQFQLGTDFKAWALSVAYWQARAWMTERKRKSWLLFNDQLVQTIGEHFTEKPEPSPGLDTAALSQCLGKLKERDHLLVLAYYQHEKSLHECSRIFGLSPDSLKVTLFRIRAALRRCIEAKLQLEDVRP